MTTNQPTETPRLDSAYKDCLDGSGNITRLEPLYEEFEKVERELNAAKQELIETHKNWREEATELHEKLTVAQAEIARIKCPPSKSFADALGQCCTGHRGQVLTLGPIEHYVKGLEGEITRLREAVNKP